MLFCIYFCFKNNFIKTIVLIYGIVLLSYNVYINNYINKAINTYNISYINEYINKYSIVKAKKQRVPSIKSTLNKYKTELKSLIKECNKLSNTKIIVKMIKSQLVKIKKMIK